MNPQIPQFQPLPPESPVPGSTLSPHPIGEKVVETTSHVTAQPNAMPGYNYDPQMRAQWANEPDVVHATRPIEPSVMSVSPELAQKHEEAKRQYPELNLSEGEYVLMSIARHPIGLFAPIGVGTLIIVILLSFLLLYPSIVAESPASGLPGMGVISLVVIPLCLLVGLFAYIAVWIYLRNRFYLTNESVIQEIQHSLFSKHEQTASLGSIEDVSYRQNGLIQSMFNYGTIRLSTEGDETTYRFYYVSSPKQQTATLTNAVESFKNGRPVNSD